jgi:hypothetical protein
MRAAEKGGKRQPTPRHYHRNGCTAQGMRAGAKPQRGYFAFLPPGYRLMSRRDPVGIRLITRRGHDWSGRFLEPY